MDPFDLPITVRLDGAEHLLVLSCLGGVPLAAALPPILEELGADPGTRLHLGWGAVNPEWVVGRPPLLAHTVLADRPQSTPDTGVGLVGLSCVGGPDCGETIGLDRSPVVVGRAPTATPRLVLDDPELSRCHLRLSTGSDELTVHDLGSTNGFRLDGLPVGASAPWPADQLLRVGGSLLRVGLVAGRPAALHPDGRGRLVLHRPANPFPPWRPPDVPAVPEPPSRTRRALPWLAAAIGALLGVGIALLTGIWTFLLLAAFGPITMIATAVGDRIGGRRSYRLESAAHRERVRHRETVLAEQVRMDRQHDWDQHPDPATLIRWAVDRSARLWERRPEDPGRLAVRVGTGIRAARVNCADPPDLDHCPLLVDLRRCPVLGISGAGRLSSVRVILLQLATLCAPEDLEVLIAGTWLPELRGLPHGGDAVDPEDIVAALLRGPGPRHRVLVLPDPTGTGPPAGLDQLLARAPELRVSVICTARQPTELPSGCTAVLLLPAAGGAVTLELRTAEDTLTGAADGLRSELLGRAVRALAPLGTGAASGSPLPLTVGLGELTGLPTTESGLVDRLRTNWQTPSLRTALGSADHRMLTFDLDRDGPHLLIAGTTGSGKSELLRTLIAGLAAAAPPDLVSFLLVDYKGGAAFAEAAQLPHTVGLVSDLDPASAGRALRSLRAELIHRERLLHEAGHSDIAGWQQAGRCSLARLVIVVDEFATLATDLPTFLSGLIDVAQRGRSLGVHLVLATQRPAGVVSPVIKANVSGRICLRVTDDADSTDVIDRADAAALPAGLPGRAYLRTGRREVTLFQTAQVSGAHRVREDPVRVFRAGNSSAQDPDVPGRSLLTVLTQACRTAAAGRRPPRRPWLPGLPTRLEPSAVPADAVALLDLPEQQDQQPLALAQGPLLVLGAPGSGRSTALRAGVAAAGAAELVVLDPARGLADLAALPQCASYLDGTEPALMLRLLDRLRSRLDADPVPDRLLVLVDTYESLVAATEPDGHLVAPALTELAARGPAAGITLLLAGSGRLRHAAIAGSFGRRIELADEDHPADPPGRGRTAGADLQVVLVEPGRVPEGPGHRSAPVVRPLPTAPAAEPELPGRVALGIGGDAAEPVTFDLFGPGGAFLVAGPRRSGVSTALGRFRAAAAGQLVDVDRRTDPAALRAFLSTHSGPLVVIADDAHLFPDGDLTTLLLRFLEVAGPGQHLVLGCLTDAAARSFRGLVSEAAAGRRGLLLQPESADGALLGLRLPRARLLPRPGRGVLADGGEGTPIQVYRPAPHAC